MPERGGYGGMRNACLDACGLRIVILSDMILHVNHVQYIGQVGVPRRMNIRDGSIQGHMHSVRSK
jgi:hypothetical protein